MKIKRYVAPDIRQAMRLVKEELGADAVIMSNRRVENGVEIVAARDFDEQQIHLHAQQQSAELDHKQRQAKKNVENVHIVSSKRKRQSDGSMPKIPRREMSENYLGYAEKVALNSSKRELKQPRKNPADTVNQHAAKTTSQKSWQAPVVESAPELNKDNQQALTEMRQEILQLKNILQFNADNARTMQAGHANTVRMDLLQRLTDIGISSLLADKITKRLGSHKDLELAWGKAQEMLVNMLPSATENILQEGGVVALVGPTGVGKTTSIAKLAAQYILQHGSREVALISTDNYRIAAHEQLKMYGRILDVPVSIANHSQELRQLINSYSDKRLVLIDTAGMSQRDMKLAEQIEILQQRNIPVKSYLVMSATTQLQAMQEIVRAFKVFNPVASMITKVDEAALKGAMLSVLIEQQMPCAYISNGQQVPEDMHVPDLVALVAQCVQELQHNQNYQQTQNSDDLFAAGYA